MYQSKHCLPQSQWHLRVYWRSFFGLAQASNMRRRGKQGSSHSVVCLFSASRVQSYPGSAIHIACLQHAKKECCCFTRINTRSEHETRQHAPFSGKPKQEFPENMWNLTGRALAHHLSGISVADRLQFLHSLLQHQNLLLDTWHGLRGNGGNRIYHASWNQFLNNGKSNQSLQCSLHVGHALETPNSLSNETAQSKVDELNWSHYCTSSSSFSDFSTSASRNA